MAGSSSGGMKLRIEQEQLFADATLTYRGRVLQLNSVMLDTGSAGTLFSVDHLTNIGLQYEPNDQVHRIRGVGGTEFVLTKRLRNFVVEAGVLEWL
jgi:hypothetical protein